MNTQGDYLTIQETAEFLSCHYNTVYKYVVTGKLPAYRYMSTYRIKRSELIEWIKKHKFEQKKGQDA